jgi:porin
MQPTDQGVPLPHTPARSSVSQLILLALATLVPAFVILGIFILATSNRAQAQLQSEMSAPWSESRQSWRDQGVNIRLLYRMDASTFPSASNLSANQALILGNLDLQADFDLEKILGANGLRVFLWGVNNHGKNPSSMVGDFQFTSNIQPNNPGTKLLEAFVEQNLLDNRLSLLVGIRDLNSEFNLTESSLPLLNSSFTLGGELAQAGVAGPSTFPNTAMGARAHYSWSDEGLIRVAAFNDEPALRDGSGVGFTLSPEQGLLWIGEAEQTWNRTTLKAGAWTYGNKEIGANGYYGLAEQVLNPRATVFLRYGRANGSELTLDSNLATGITWTGPFAGRREDQLSLGVTTATAREPELTAPETAYEATYRITVAPGFVVQPDFQFVSHPNFDQNGAESAWVGSTRLEVIF